MSKIGLFFGSSTGNSENVARTIAKCFHPIEVDIYDIRYDHSHLIKEYSKLIFGIPSWNRHYQQDDWHTFLPQISSVEFTGKKIALYGLGDQVNYPQNFVDTMGIIYDWLTERKATIVGICPVSDYHFSKSKAVRNGKFVGLALDEDNQYQLTLPRIIKWTHILKNEFELNLQ